MNEIDGPEWVIIVRYIGQTFVTKKHHVRVVKNSDLQCDAFAVEPSLSIQFHLYKMKKMVAGVNVILYAIVND